MGESMTVILAIIILVEFIWLLALQDSLGGLRFKIRQLEKHLPQHPSGTAENAPAQTPVSQAAPVFQTPVQQPAPAAPAVRQERAAEPAKPASPAPQKPDFTVAKLFSWIGGFTLLLGVIFWIKYAIENDLISPELRIAASILLGVGLWTVGVLIQKPALKTTSDTLCASGLCICYAALFSAYYFYQLLGQPAAFILLGLTALAAFGTAVWRSAKYIGFLAQIIGFLTPFLFPSQDPNLFFLLSYFAFINAAAAAAALKRGWNGQIFSSVAFTTLCLLFVVPGIKNTPAALHILMGFTLFFGALYGLAAFLRRKGEFLLAACVLTALVQFEYLILFICTSSYGETLALPFCIWTAVMCALFAGAPFAFKERFFADKFAWAAVSVSGAAACLIILMTLRHACDWNNGLIPLVFAAAYGFIAAHVYRWQPLDEGIQRLRLTWLDGAAALFFTLAVVCQLERAWLTLALAGEGCALIWLNHKLGHGGLTELGKWLLGAACVRLVLNPAVLDYYAGTTKIFNWYLYAYGLSAAAMLLAARGWLPRKDTGSIHFLQALAGITLFALVNIEIADYFSAGGTLEFELFGDVTAAAAYTVAWAVCGAVCLFLALGDAKSWLHKAGLGLVAAALAKLFLSDVWKLETSSRIIVLIGVAVILMAVSFVYQQFRASKRISSEEEK